MRGKIIAVVGAPGCGKSFLVRKLAKHYKAPSIMEGEAEDLPEKIKDGLARHEKNLEVFLWFRNKYVKEMLEAEQLVSSGRMVIMDAYWMLNESYINHQLAGSEKELAKEICALDRKWLTSPDVVVYLRASESKLIELIRKRGRHFEANEKFRRLASDVSREHDRIFSRRRLKNLIIIERHSVDFNDPSQLGKLIKKIDNML